MKPIGSFPKKPAPSLVQKPAPSEITDEQLQEIFSLFTATSWPLKYVLDNSENMGDLKKDLLILLEIDQAIVCALRSLMRGEHGITDAFKIRAGYEKNDPDRAKTLPIWAAYKRALLACRTTKKCSCSSASDDADDGSSTSQNMDMKF